MWCAFLRLSESAYLFFLALLCGMWHLSSPDQGPSLGPRQWKCGVRATVPPGNSHESEYLTITDLFIYYKFIYLFFGLCWAFVAARGLSLVAASRGYSFAVHWLLIAVASLCCGAPALGVRASVVVAHRLSSCGARASLFRGMWDLPGPGLEPVSPALAGGFLTTAPPGKSNYL